MKKILLALLFLSSVIINETKCIDTDLILSRFEPDNV